MKKLISTYLVISFCLLFNSGFATDYLVSDAGTVGANGTYFEAGVSGGKPYYQKPNGSFPYFLIWMTDHWEIYQITMMGADMLYYNYATDNTPPTNGWSVDGAGDFPAPSLSIVSSNADPSITSTAVTTGTAGELYTYNITTSDDDGDAVSITAPTCPAWLTLNSSPSGAGNSTSYGSGGFTDAHGLDFASDGKLYVTDWSQNVVKVISSDGSTTSFFYGPSYPHDHYLWEPEDIEIDGNGNMYIIDKQTSCDIHKISSAGAFIQEANINSSYTNHIDVTDDGTVYFTECWNNTVRKLSSDFSTVTTIASGFNIPMGIVHDGSGNLYVADYNNNAIKKIDSDDNVTTIATMNKPECMTMDGNGNLFITSDDNSVVKKYDISEDEFTTVYNYDNGLTFTNDIEVSTSGELYITGNSNYGDVIKIAFDVNEYSLSGTPSSGGTYAVSIAASDGNGGSDTQNFNIIVSGGGGGGGDTQTFTVSLEDSFGDGWNGGSIDVLVEGSVVLNDLTLNNGSGPETHTFEVSCNQTITTNFTSGNWAYENEYQIINASDFVVAESGQGGATPGDISYTYSCESGDPTWTGAVSYDWNEGGNWSTGSVPELGDNVIIADEAYYPIIYQGESGDCNDLTVESGATLWIKNNASLITNGTITNNGTIEIQKTVSANKWHLFSTPLTSEVSGTFAGDYLQEWNESIGFWEEITGLITNLSVMKGYGLHSTSKRTYNFSGTPSTGSQSIELSYTDYSSEPDAFEGANSIGNPYPSSIDWNDFDETWGAVYYWNPEHDNGDGTFGKYIIWNDGVGTHGATQYIAPMQAFFIVINEGNHGSSLSFSNSNRTHSGASSFYKATSKLRNGLILEAITNGATDELIIKFNNHADSYFNEQFDALKLFSHSNTFCQLYSKVDGKNLSIDTRNETERIVLGFRNQKSGAYAINVKESDGISSVELEDTKLNKFHDLTSGAYNFDWQTTDLEERFILHLKATGLAEETQQEIRVYEANERVYVKLNETDEYEQILIYDLAGRLVYENNLSKQNLQSFDLSHLQGAYLVQLVSGSRNIVQKIVLK